MPLSPKNGTTPHPLKKLANYYKRVIQNLWERNKDWIKYKPQEEWIVKEGAHEPIISKETDDKVQERMKERSIKYKIKKIRGQGNYYNTPYLVTGGMMVCGKCGKNAQG